MERSRARGRSTRTDSCSIGDACNAWLASTGLSGVATLAAVSACWDEVVGPDVAAHAQPVLAGPDELVVGVDHPGWATEMAFLAPGILSSLEQHLGTPVAGRLKVTVRP